MQQTLKRLWFLALISISVMLTACGGAGGEAPKRTLTDSDYVLEFSGKLEASQFDPGAELWPLTFSEMTADSSRTHWLQSSFPVAADGGYRVMLDAREIEGEGVDPRAFVEYRLLYQGDNDVTTISVSDPAARLGVMVDTRLMQQNPSSNTVRASHSLDYVVDYEVEGVSVRRSALLVFSDTDVRIEATVGPPGSAPHTKVDLSMEVGWNLVYLRLRNFDYVTDEYVARPVMADDQLVVGGLFRRIASGSDDGLAGYSVVTAHQVQDNAPPEMLYYNGWYGSSNNIWTPTWLNSSDVSHSLLTPFEQALPGSIVDGSLDFSVEGVRGLLATILYYDEPAASNERWWDDPSLSTGELQLISENENPILVIYSDRTASLDVNSVVLDSDPNQTLEAIDLQLEFGWNLVEKRPSKTELGVFQLISYDGSAEDWNLVPHDLEVATDG